MNIDKKKWGKLFGLAGIKILTTAMALIIVVISVMGFTSLMGGMSGMIIGAIFGLAEIAFIMYFPTTLKHWSSISNLSKISMTAVILVLGTLSFASTHSFITKSIVAVTEKADQSNQDLILTNSKITGNKEDIATAKMEREKLKVSKNDIEIKITGAIRNQEMKATKLRTIIYNKGRLCRGDCAARQRVGQIELDDASDILKKFRLEKATIIQNLGSKSKLIDGLQGNSIALKQLLYQKKESTLESNNIMKQYAGYKTVGEKINSIFNTDKDPIHVFTTAVALILYSLYIILNIWMYGVIGRTKKRSYGVMWSLATRIATKKANERNQSIADQQEIQIDNLNKKVARQDIFIQGLTNLGGLVTVKDILKAEKEVVKEEAAISYIERKQMFITFLFTVFKYSLSIMFIFLIFIATTFGIVKTVEKIDKDTIVTIIDSIKDK